MDGQSNGNEEGSFLPSEEAIGKEDPVEEAAGDAVIEEEEKEENVGGDQLAGEGCEDPVENNGQAIEDCGQAVGDGEVKEDGGNGEVGEDVNEALGEGESNVEAVENEKGDGQTAGESNVETAEDEESYVPAAGDSRRGAISEGTIEEPEESIQEKVRVSSHCFQHHYIIIRLPCQRLMMV